LLGAAPSAFAHRKKNYAPRERKPKGEAIDTRRHLFANPKLTFHSPSLTTLGQQIASFLFEIQEAENHYHFQKKVNAIRFLLLLNETMVRLVFGGSQGRLACCLLIRVG
jgi:hypothetical protein